MQYLIRIFQKGKYLFVYTISEKIVFFILFVLLARNFSTKVFGTVTVVFVISNLLNSVMNLGMPSYFQRKLARSQDLTASGLRQAILLKFNFIVLLLPASAMYFYHNNFVYPGSMTAIALGIFILGINQLLRSALFGMNLFEEIVIPKLSSGLFLVVLGCLALIAGMLEVFAVIMFISPMIEMFLLLGKLRNRGLHFKVALPDENANLWKIFNSSLPFAVGVVCIMLYDRADILIVEKILGLEAVAVYGIAYSIYKISHQLCVPFLMPLYTDLSSEYHKHHSVGNYKIFNVAAAILIYSFACITAYHFGAEYIVTLFYGKIYLEAVKFIEIIVFSLPLVIMNNFTGILLNSTDREKSVRNSVIAGTIINISANIILISRYGIYGAVASTILTELSILVFQTVVLAKSSTKSKKIKLRENEYNVDRGLFRS